MRYIATTDDGHVCYSRPTDTACTITRLTNGRPYTVTVTATTIAGISVPSAVAGPVTPAAPTVSRAPVNPHAAMADRSANVSR